jgi:hypothetical protein
MWRRIPILPMLFGACAALSLMTIASVREPFMVGGVAWRAYVAAGALGAAYALLVYAVVTALPLPRSTFDNVGCGCFYAAAGFFFLLVPVAVVALSTAAEGYEIQGWTILASLLGFVGLGLLGGVMLARFRRVSAERQAAVIAEQQLELARDLQQRLLPLAPLETDRYRVTARNVPAAYVAGDFYDFVPLGPDRLLLVLADVSGKGVRAGLIMATVKAMIPLLAAEQSNPAPLLGRLNERLAGQLPQREFVALTLAIYDAGRGTMTVANAGLPDPLVLPSMKTIAVTGPRYPVGIRKTLPYESLTVSMAAGDRLVLFTDGLPEATVGGEPLGYERLATEIQRSGGDLDALFTALDKLGAGHEDDWTAIAFERRG